jgi:membrane-associated phospholipid phosphatase
MGQFTYREARRALIWSVGASHLLMVLCLFTTKVRLDFYQTAQAYCMAGIPLSLMFYAYWRRMRRLYALFDTLVAAFLVTTPALVWTYAGMSLALPLADADLIAMDEALGFDWWNFISFVDARPRLAQMLAFAYWSFPYQFLLLPAWFAALGNGVRACAFVFCFGLLCLISSIIGIWYPALGTYVFYGVGNDDLVNINAKYGFFFLEQFHAVRDQPEFVLKLQQAAGIVTFPSVHAGVAGLCIWAAWDSRVLRYPLILLNVAMATSAVSHANHYLMDVVAGLGIAGLTVSIATALFYRPSADESFVTAAIERFRYARRRQTVTSEKSPASASD